MHNLLRKCCSFGFANRLRFAVSVRIPDSQSGFTERKAALSSVDLWRFFFEKQNYALISRERRPAAKRE